MKKCKRCGNQLAESRTGKFYCRPCNNRAQHERKKRPGYKDRERIQRIKHDYGISLGEYHILLQYCFGCSICHTLDNLVIDHDHKTNKVRGILCHSCNKGLGSFEDSTDRLAAAKDYLLHPPAEIL